MGVLNFLLFAVLGVALAALNDNGAKRSVFRRASYWVALFCAVGIGVTAAIA